jgi:transcriptional regulator GlxA family with amidase domain
MKKTRQRTVGILALDGVVPFDLGIACDVFSRALLPNGRPAYQVRVCGEAARIDAGVFALQPPARLAELDKVDIVVVPGFEDILKPPSRAVWNALRSANARGALIASICTGAFILAACGLLDGKRATTHWAAADELARRFPKVTVDPNVLYVDEGAIVTSAGSSAGLDMCLYLVGRHHGQAVAAESARMAVAPLQRDGGQAPYIRHVPLASSVSLSPLLDWLLKNLHQAVDINGLAARAAMSPRTFARRFREQTGTTPIQWLIANRVRRAQELLETCDLSVDQIAMAAGFDSPVTFRARFRRLVGVTPTEYRRRFA